MRSNWSSDKDLEVAFGYSRAVQIGNLIEISGTTSMESSKVIGLGDITLQTEYILKKIEFTLSEAGFDLSHVIRTRIFVTNISLWEDVARVHSYLFENILPASSLVEVSQLIHPDLLIEIEATAIKENS